MSDATVRKEIAVTFGLLQFVQETSKDSRVLFAQRPVELLEPSLDVLPIIAGVLQTATVTSYPKLEMELDSDSMRRCLEKALANR